MKYAMFLLAAALELSGCYLVWMGQRQSSMVITAAGVTVLAAFGYTLYLVSGNLPSRAYAAYGGIYIAAALVWMVVVDKHAPDRWDITGVVITIAGAMVILFGPRS